VDVIEEKWNSDVVFSLVFYLKTELYGGAKSLGKVG
jgi:hypothetical protein